MMHKKNTWARFSRMVIAAAVAGLISLCSNSESKTQKTPVVEKSVAVDASKNVRPLENRSVTVYYFHGNARCQTCHKLEDFARSEIEAGFADAIKTGALKWMAVNVEESGNEHFSDEYKLYTKSIIISIRQGEKETSWKNLDQIWQLVHEERKYREYIRNEVSACLQGKCL